MKKPLIVFLCVIFLLLCGCNTNDSPSDNTVLNPAGTYTDVSFNDTNSIYVDFKLQAAGKAKDKETIVITAQDDSYRDRDSLHSGRFTYNGDGDFTAKKETVITDDPLFLKLAEQELQQNPYTSYTVYDNYLIKKVPVGVVSIKGELPGEGKKATCFIRIEHAAFSSYTLSFSADGSCEMMTIFNGDICSSSGTYSVKGSIFSLSFTEGNFYGEELSGNVEMVLYTEDNTLYNQVYRKN